MCPWWLALLCVSLSCIECVPTAVLHRKYLGSYRLTRFTRRHVQQLLVKYKTEQLGSTDYEDRSQHLKELPTLSMDYYHWRNLTDRERLGGALSDMEAFRTMLEWKRKQLNSTETNSTVPQNFQHIECDLRDLATQVNSQMKHIGGTWIRAHPPREHSRTSATLWDRRVEGYIILRDLELYLIKLARDFLVLAHTQALSGNGITS